MLMESVPGKTEFLTKDGPLSWCPSVAQRERALLLPLIIRMLIPSCGPTFMTSSDLIQPSFSGRQPFQHPETLLVTLGPSLLTGTSPSPSIG